MSKLHSSPHDQYWVHPGDVKEEDLEPPVINPILSLAVFQTMNNKGKAEENNKRYLGC